MKVGQNLSQGCQGVAQVININHWPRNVSQLDAACAQVEATRKSEARNGQLGKRCGGPRQIIELDMANEPCNIFLIMSFNDRNYIQTFRAALTKF